MGDLIFELFQTGDIWVPPLVSAVLASSATNLYTQRREKQQGLARNKSHAEFLLFASSRLRNEASLYIIKYGIKTARDNSGVHISDTTALTSQLPNIEHTSFSYLFDKNSKQAITQYSVMLSSFHAMQGLLKENHNILQIFREKLQSSSSTKRLTENGDGIYIPEDDPAIDWTLRKRVKESSQASIDGAEDLVKRCSAFIDIFQVYLSHKWPKDDWTIE